MNMIKLQKFSAGLSILIAVTSFALTHSASAAGRQFHFFEGAHRKVCAVATLSTTHCFAQVISDSSGNPTVAASLPAGYGPAQIHGAYQLPSTSANPGIIAVVDAYDDPNVSADLATYDKTFGLPVFPSCSNTLKTSCFSKVSQSGGSFYPQRNSSWGIEISLDVETAHQVCQNCKLILVEANSSSYGNLMSAVDRARLLGATAISNSYGSSEFAGENTYDSHFNYPGIAFVFSSGDAGYGATYPAASPFVTSVGGTTLNVNSANAWLSESVWTDGGSGCSSFEAKPGFQKDLGCANRAIADVAADADPNTGAAVYDSYGYYGYRGWFQVGGTSLAAPIVAGIYGLANNTSSLAHANAITYSDFQYGTNLHDITSGTNGGCGTYLCQAGVGYDGPSGLGTPEGLGAF
jgi:subtilase family serine protease